MSFKVASLLLSFTASLLTHSSPAQSKSGSINSPAHLLEGPVQLHSAPDVLLGQVHGFPRVLPGPAVPQAVAGTINDALARDEARVREEAISCRADLHAHTHQPTEDAWQRTIAVTMRGPRFLSYLISDTYYCGGPYPNDGLQTPFVFDLTTGRPVNWLKLLPTGLTAELGNSADGSKAGWVVWHSAQQLAQRQADIDCKDAFDAGPIPFALYPDAASGTLHLLPADFPHVVQACAETIILNPAQLQQLGASPDLMSTLRTARKLQERTSAKP